MNDDYGRALAFIKSAVDRLDSEDISAEPFTQNGYPDGACIFFIDGADAVVVSARPLGSRREDDPDFDVWGENPDHSRKDWAYEAANGDTNLGYWDWVDSETELALDEEDEEDA